MSAQNVGLWFIMVRNVIWILLVAKWNLVLYMIFNLLQVMVICKTKKLSIVLNYIEFTKLIVKAHSFCNFSNILSDKYGIKKVNYTNNIDFWKFVNSKALKLAALWK